jgi:uncharacterized membrane protein
MIMGLAKGTTALTRMNAARKSIVVKAPLNTVYQQWLKGEEFPKFIPAITSSHRLDPNHFAVSISLNGQQHEAVLELTLRIPERRLVWRALGNRPAAGVVSFTPRPDQSTIVGLTLMSTFGGHISDRVERYLDNFKHLIEEQVRKYEDSSDF